MEEWSPCHKVADALNEIIRLVRTTQPDVVWASYDTLDDVLSELDEHVERLDRGDLSKKSELRILFAPTGPLQELSISGGWGDQFLAIAARFDRAIAKVG